MTISRLPLLAALLLAIAAPARAAGIAGFGDPYPAGPTGLAGAELTGAVRQGDGSVRLLYRRFGTVATVLAAPGVTPQILGGPGAGGEALTALPGGAALAAWGDDDQVHAAWGGPMTLGEAQTLVSPAAGVSEVRAAAAGDGTVVVEWITGSVGVGSERTIYAAVRRPGMPFGSAAAVASGDDLYGLRLAGGADGTVAATWHVDADAAANVAVLAPGASAFGAPERIPAQGFERTSVAVAPDGTVLLAGDGRTVLRRAPDGTIAPPEPVAGDGGLAAIAAAPGGTVGLAVQSGQDVKLFVAPPGGGFAAPVLLGSRTDAQAAMDLQLWDDGSAVVTTSGSVGDDDLPVTGLYRTGSAAGAEPLLALGPPAVVARGLAPGTASVLLADGGRLLRLDTDGPLSRRPARLRTGTTPIFAYGPSAHPWDMRVVVWVATDPAATLTATVRRRTGRTWRVVPSSFLDGGAQPLVSPFTSAALAVPLSGVPTRCPRSVRVPLRLTIVATTRAGRRTVLRRAFTARCPVR